MRARLANKIVNKTYQFHGWGSNYLPYSTPQQEKATKIYTRKLGYAVRQTLSLNIGCKIPLKYRKSKGPLPDEFNSITI